MSDPGTRNGTHGQVERPRPQTEAPMVITTPNGEVRTGQQSRYRTTARASYTNLVDLFGQPDIRPAIWLLRISQNGRRCPAVVLLRPDPADDTFNPVRYRGVAGRWELIAPVDTVCVPVLAAIRGEHP